ncbi:MAG TPA: tetratricopeptide repeat protein [Desulfomonilia bacterium]
MILLGILVFGLYFNIIYNKPTNWDDPVLIENPQNYAPSMDNIRRIFTITDTGTWQPVRDLSYVIDYSILPSDPVLAMHIHSILLYFFMCLAVFMFLYELLSALGKDDKTAFLASALSTILFAVHPVHVETVAWLYARKEPLLGLFTMLSMWAFVKARRGHPAYFTASAVALILAVLSKPTAIALPAAMLAVDIAIQMYNPERGFWKRRAIFFALILLFILPFTFWFMKMIYSAGGVKPYHGGTFAKNMLAVSQICIEYIRLIAFNIDFVADYPIKLHTSVRDWHAWMFVFLNLVLVSSAIFFLIKKGFVAFIFIAWYYIFILPVSHIFPISQTLADRYAFLSSLSWCVLLGYLLASLRFKRLNFKKLSPNLPALAAFVIFAMIVSAYSYMTCRQTFIWRNSQTLWENTVVRFPNSNSASVNLSVIYIGQGRYEAAQQLCVNAIRNLPYDYLAISNLALAQMLMGQYDNAIHNYKEALKLSPDMDRAKMGLANCFWQKGDWKTSCNIYLTLIESGYNIKSSGHEGLVLARLSFAANKMGNKTESDRLLERGYAVSRGRPEFLVSIAEIATSLGRKDIAARAYNSVLPMLKKPEARARIKSRLDSLNSN